MLEDEVVEVEEIGIIVGIPEFEGDKVSITGVLREIDMSGLPCVVLCGAQCVNGNKR